MFIKTPLIVGILALQGGFAEHANMIRGLGHKARLIRCMEDAEGIDACILPGGESTVIMKQLKKTGLDEWLKETAKNGMPIYGTCAGMIILANLGLIDLEVDRNAYGSQLDSFEKELDVSRFIGAPAYEGIFIRAPKIKTLGKDVEVLVSDGDSPLLVRQGKVMAGSFHPELTDDPRIHKYFLTA